ncbi:hypothetical protein LJC38_00615 [Parabacteroides sp. OttesenSCG-928-K15]|nr:hypothetical protein [Parabacteroides sp. OttesenSCG-928-K15]
MKKLFMLVLVSSLLMACGNKKAEQANSGAATKSEVATEVYKLDDLLANADQLLGQTVKVRGSVTHTCSHSGKRCFLVGDNENVTMRVEAKGNISSFNKELIGSELEVTGILQENRLSKEYIDQMEKETEEKMEEDGSAESCEAELSNINAMREWMKANNKDHYSIYFLDGQDYEIIE